jgi:CheY-like chemotaxis protein
VATWKEGAVHNKEYRDEEIIDWASAEVLSSGRCSSRQTRPRTKGCNGTKMPPKKDLDMSQKKILIVDDDPDIRLSLHVRLKANHYDVIFAMDGVGAMAQARKHVPDLIILDLGLPAGDGFVVLERLQANDTLSLIPVLVVSGRDRNANRDRALKAGARAFLLKPVDNARLLSAIRQILGEKDQTAEVVYDLGARDPES